MFRSSFLFLSISMLILFVMPGCRDDCESPVVVMPKDSLEVGGSYFVMTINGQLFDTLQFSCNKSLTSMFVGWIDDDQSFILREGPENVPISDSILLSMYVFIFDSTTSYSIYTPEILAFYIEERKSNVSVDVQLEINDAIYRNQWYTDWEIDDYIQRDIVDSNAEYSIIPFDKVAPRCTDFWPLLPIIVEYSGSLSTESGTDSVSIESLVAKIHLLEAF